MSDQLICLPLCELTHQLSYCPVFNPLFPNHFYPSSTKLYCQEGVEVGGVTGGWPPPCQLTSLQFFVIDSSRYWSLAESMGVVEGRDQPMLIIADYKVQ